MGTNASFTSGHLAGLWAPLHGFLSWFVTAPAKLKPFEERYAQNKLGKSLLGMREFEPGASPACAGRMVIAGRMADVCAELERMSQTQRAH